MRNNQLFNGSLIFFLVIIGALVAGFINNKVNGYKVSNAEIQQLVLNDNFTLNYGEFERDIISNLSNFYVLDIRNDKDYKTGHIEGAENIIPEQAFTKETIKKLKKSKKPLVIYSDSQANSAKYMIYYKSIGLNEVFILAGDYNTYVERHSDKAYSNYDAEKQSYSYKNFIKQADKPVEIDHTPVMVRAKGGC